MHEIDMTRKCIRCDEDLIPGEDWPESSQNTKLYVHKTCHKRHQKGFNDWRRAIEVGEGLSRAQYSELDREEQKRLRDKYKDINAEGAYLKSANTRTDPPKRRNVPEPKFVTRVRSGWDDAAASAALHHNLWLRFKVCEYTGIAKPDCHEAHVLSRELCRQHDHPEWVIDEDNVMFIFSALNEAMTRQGYWLHPNGLYMPAPGGEHAPWMHDLGVVGKRIEMTERRSWFAGLAAPICIL